MRLSSEELARYFDEFVGSAFRLEMRQVYTMPSEQVNLRRFLSDEPKPDGHNAAWREKVGRWTGAGKTVTRAKAVRRPLSDYLRYQSAWGIPGNVAAGEDYWMVDITADDLGLPEQDFWLFDDKAVVHLDYNPDGTFIGAELVVEPDLARYRAWRDRAVSHGVSFGEWDAGARSAE